MHCSFIRFEKSVSFTITSFDPNNNPVSYYVDWGDGTDEWTNVYGSTENVNILHIWSEIGNYTIKAKAQECPDGSIGPEETFSINITPRRRAQINIPFIEFLKNHPNIYLILRLLLQL